MAFRILPFLEWFKVSTKIKVVLYSTLQFVSNRFFLTFDSEARKYFLLYWSEWGFKLLD